MATQIFVDISAAICAQYHLRYARENIFIKKAPAFAEAFC
jgi:hypothetical protein